MLRHTWRRLRADRVRAVATGMSVLLAVTSFVVLTGSAEQSRLEARSTMDAAFRSSYDILVRPKGSQTEVEKATGRVRPNYLSGLYGGITTEQAERIKGLDGVEIAAPIAMVGQIFQFAEMSVDVTDLVGKSGRTVLRFTTKDVSARGTSSVQSKSGYFYVTDKMVPRDLATDHNDEVVNGKNVAVCWDRSTLRPPKTPFAEDARWSPRCLDRTSASTEYTHGRYVIRVIVPYPVTLAAVDPAAEARLTGLDKAMVTGTLAEGLGDPAPSPALVTVPVITSRHSFVDQATTMTIERLDTSVANRIAAGMSASESMRVVKAAKGTTVRTRTMQLGETIQKVATDPGFARRIVSGIFRPGQVTYDQKGPDRLAPRTVVVPPTIWKTPKVDNMPFDHVPIAAEDTSYRPAQFIPSVEEAPLSVELLRSGTFDPSRLIRTSKLSEVPLETYQPPSAAPADDRTRKLLGGKDLAPDANPAGYLQQPPLLLTNISSLPYLLSSKAFEFPDPKVADAPISVVRVRVKDVHGTDAQSRERIRLTAERIQQATGLDVDITVGSSPHLTTVDLPATKHGAPPMSIHEKWVQKGVTAVLTSAIDRKSLVLFLLILAATALSVSISANASVRARRTELGVLSCIGWRPTVILRHVLAELLLIGSVAGVVGALVAVPLGHALGAPVPAWRATLAVPAALLLVLVAGAVPALAAARTTPAVAVRPPVTTGRRHVRLRGTASMAAGSLLRTPGRALTAALALALGLTALTSLVGIVVGFNGQVVGTLLGDAIAVQVRGGDLVAAAVLTLIGIGALLNVLFLDVRENAAHYASLQGAGWRDATLARLVVWQAAIIGLLGAVAGTLAGLGLVAYLTDVTGAVVWTAVGIGAAGLVLTCALALLPAARLRRLPTARLLSAD